MKERKNISNSNKKRMIRRKYNGRGKTVMTTCGVVSWISDETTDVNICVWWFAAC